MELKTEKTCNWLTWCIITATLVVFHLVTLISDERFLYLGLSTAIIFTYILSKNRTISFHFSGYHLYIISFVAFCYLSSFWAYNRQYTIGRGNTFLLVAMVMFSISFCFSGADNIDQMLKAVMWSGFIIALYTIYLYGLSDVVFYIQTESRLGMDNRFLNPNEIGICTSYSMFISIYYLLFRKNKWYLLLDIPAFLVILATEGKKSFLILLFGAFLLFLFKNADNSGFVKNVFKILTYALVAVVGIYFLSRLSIFNGITERFSQMMQSLTGDTQASVSTTSRLNLIEFGFTIFKEHPLLGIGIDNSEVLIYDWFHRSNYYLHCNYIEMLADGGIVGFLVYYSIYIFLLTKMIKLRKFSDPEFDICLSMLIINLIMDIAVVSFLDRATYFYLLIFYTKLKSIQKQQFIPEHPKQL